MTSMGVRERMGLVGVTSLATLVGVVRRVQVGRRAARSQVRREVLFPMGQARVSILPKNRGSSAAANLEKAKSQSAAAAKKAKVQSAKGVAAKKK